jgi:hypothetical protein
MRWTAPSASPARPPAETWVAICGCHPFFSTSDWFIGTGEMDAGIPQAVSRLVLKFDYNDRASLQALFDAHPGRIACVLMEAARIDEPDGDYLHWVKQCAHDHGALLVFDEMITGFRWHNGGAQTLYGVAPDLATFGKALANGFSVSALAGRRELMKLGGLHHDQDRVFLLSTTHGAQTHELAAAIATMQFYRDHPVVEVLHQRGARLRQGIEQAATALGLSAQVGGGQPGLQPALLHPRRAGPAQPAAAHPVHAGAGARRGDRPLLRGQLVPQRSGHRPHRRCRRRGDEGLPPGAGQWCRALPAGPTGSARLQAATVTFRDIIHGSPIGPPDAIRLTVTPRPEPG